jgi:NAD(P)-dependent dehydrogenase (short-subunit alcohol dehydrogenase family)
MTAHRFAGQTAVITGGGSGIGLAIARRFMAEGGRVVANDIDADRAAALQSELGPHGIAMPGDVTQEADIAALFATALDRFGTVNASFHVAGANRGGYIARMAEADWDFTVDLCLKGVMFAMKHAAQAMLKNGGGAMVNIASLNAHVPMHAGAAYSAAKAGVEMLTKNGALELTPSNIRVNAILPGLVAGDRQRRVLESKAQQSGISFKEMEARAFSYTSIKEYVTPRQIADQIVFLASPRGRTISGQDISVCGDTRMLA